MVIEIILAVVILFILIIFKINGKMKTRGMTPNNRFDDPNDLMHPGNPAGPVNKFIQEHMYPKETEGNNIKIKHR